MSILPLNFFVEGESGVVEDIKGDTNLFQRLSSMGFNKGATLQVVKNDLGPLIVALGEIELQLKELLLIKSCWNQLI
nr:FeoA domain-containing protein [Clostridium botulinum]